MSQDQTKRADCSNRQGKIYVIGTGPGNLAHLTPWAEKALRGAQVVIGYDYYLSLLEPLLQGKTILGSGMRRELERGRIALGEAKKGAVVAVVSSGDPGVYGMAGVILELARQEETSLEIEVVPGVTAATAAAALLGAPLMHDFAIISLSDLLTPWEVIAKRLEAAALGDFVTVIYNPKSKKRDWQITAAQKTFLKYRNPHTPVGLVKNAYRKDQEIVITTLQDLEASLVDMFTIVVMGNSQTYQYKKMMITPRGYKL